VVGSRPDKVPDPSVPGDKVSPLRGGRPTCPNRTSDRRINKEGRFAMWVYQGYFGGRLDRTSHQSNDDDGQRDSPNFHVTIHHTNDVEPRDADGQRRERDRRVKEAEST
jgi:hypothetical protein